MTDGWGARAGEGTKRDRTARLVKVGTILQGAGERGVTPDDIARIVRVSKRTVYRDLAAVDAELDIGVWNVDGRWGADADSDLPALKLTLEEAMAIFLSARLMARHADAYDPDLGGAFGKLARALPPVLGGHVERSVSVMASLPADEPYRRNVQQLTHAWSGRRIVEFTYGSAYDGKARRRARVHPYLIEPSLTTRALYLIGWDEERRDVRTFKIERIAGLSVTPEGFTDEPGESVERRLASAWDMIADHELVEVVVRFSPGVADRVAETRWHPSQRIDREPDGALVWRVSVSGVLEVRLWILSWGDDAEVLAPAALREDIAGTFARAAARYGGG